MQNKITPEEMKYILSGQKAKDEAEKKDDDIAEYLKDILGINR